MSKGTPIDPAGAMTGLDNLRRDNPWPALVHDVEPFYLSLDGGGRHLVTDLIVERRISVAVEIGCYLCGSSRQWLEASPDLTLIGVDPWDGNWWLHITRLLREGNRTLNALDDPEGIAATVLEYGNYYVALNNIRDLADRFIPVRRFSPEALHYLKARGITPELIYIDAFKRADELEAAHALWPDAVLCGDDWNWLDETGEKRMQNVVNRFAADRGMTVVSDKETWLLTG